ncbi:MAG: amino acid adenylation domain-containing protein, partial [Candidatus Aminicenantes bacterium]
MTLGAFENRDYPFEELVRHLVKEREVGRNPLFDVMFTLQDLDIAFIPLPGLTVTPLEYDMGISKFDLTIIGEKAGDKMLFKVEYRTRLFKETTIKRLLGYFKTIVIQMMGVPGICIRDIELMPAEEKEEILSGFNDTGVDYPAHKTIYQLFAEQAQGWQDRIAVSGPAVGARFIASISYRALTEISHQQARLLGKTGVKPEVIVGLMLEPSLEMIIAILGILRAGGAYLPIDPDYPEERIKYMLKDSGVKILVTVPGLSEKFEKLLIANCQLLIVNCQGGKTPSCPQHLSTAPATAVSSSSASTLTSTLTWQVSPANLAYIIYTSGSSGKPKGVMVEHSSVVNLAFAQKRRFNIDRHDRILQFSSICFDASVEQIFIALFNGAALILINKDTLLDIDKFASFLSSRLITHLNAVPSFLNQIELQEGKGYSLKRIISGGEVCPVSLAVKLSYFCDFYNQYGPTETTVTSIALMIENEELEGTLPRLPIGRPIDNTVVYVLDKWKKPVCLGVVGELYIGGAGLARGYLNNPELTAEKFVLAHSSWLIADRKTMKVPVKFPMSYQLSAISYIYRTGDLARWLPDGNIEFFGRMDQQVKIRGFRIELGEIENQLLVMEEIKDAVVVTGEDRPGDRYLCAYLVSQEELEPSILRGHLSGCLPDYMIPSYFVQLGEIPLTPNGKVDRQALPAPGIGIGKYYAAPRDKIERNLLEIWLEILCRDALHESQLRPSLGIDDNFFELGGHSLKVTLQVSKIHKAFEVKIPLAEVFKRPTIRQLAGYIKAAKKSKYAGIEPVEKKEYYALSSAQKPMYFLQQMDVESTAYNMPCFLLLGKDMEKEKPESAFRELIRRHDSLRTSFVSVNDNPVQRIHDRVEFKIEYDRSLVNGHCSLVNCQGRGEVSSPIKIEGNRPSLLEGTRGLAPLFIKEFIRPFDLSQAPLLRVRLIELPPTPASRGGHSRPGAPASQKGKEHKYILMLDMHHIISDGVSMEVFIRDFTAVYSGKELAPLGISYKDFSVWQHSSPWRESIKNQGAYWLKQFEDEIPVLNLPLDDVRAKEQDFAGHTLHFQLEREDTERLNRFIKRQGITLFMALLAAFNILVGKLSGQDDILVGTPAGGRKQPELENIMGMFVNTLVLRSFPAGEKGIPDFLREIKEMTLGAFENRDYPFEE